MSQNETVVRKRAVQSTISVLSQPGIHSISTTPLLEISTEKGFQTKISVCELLPVFLRLAKEDDVESLLDIFDSLATDIVPMVRRSVAEQYGNVISALSNAACNDKCSFFVNIGTVLMDDPDQNVQVKAISVCLLPFLKYWNGESSKFAASRIVDYCTNKHSWRIKHAVACKMGAFLDMLGSDKYAIISSFVNLLSDPESFVRKEAAAHLYKACCCVQDNHSVSSKLWAEIPELLSDPDPDVRGASVLQCESLLNDPALRHNSNRFQDLVKALKVLLGDQDQSVQSNVVCIFVNSLGTCIPQSQRDTFLKELYSRAKDESTSWRVIKTIVEAIPKSAASMQSSWCVDSGGFDFFIFTMFHKVSAIRMVACSVINDLEVIFGSEWFSSHVYPLVTKMATSKQKYGLRVSSLYAVDAMLRSPRDHFPFASSIVMKLLEDDVPNVRIKAIQTFPILSHKAPTEDVKVALQNDFNKSFDLEEDHDVLQCRMNVQH